MTIYTDADHVYIRIRTEGRDIEQLLLLKKPQSAAYGASIIGSHCRGLKSDMEVRELAQDEEPEVSQIDPADAEPKKKKGFQKKTAK